MWVGPPGWAHPFSMAPLRGTSALSLTTVASGCTPNIPIGSVRHQPPSLIEVHTTICVNPAMCVEYQIPQGYRTEGVSISSTILQRILREYKNISRPVGKRGEILPHCASTCHPQRKCVLHPHPREG